MNDLNGFAVDLGGTKLAAARIEKGIVVEKKVEPTNASSDARAQCMAMKVLLEKMGWQNHPISISVAGRVTANGEWSAVNKGTLPKIDAVPVRQVAQMCFEAPVTLHNDALAAAFAEAHFGAGRDVDHFAYITVSTGVGGGIVLNGLPIKSADGLAGHLGFMSSPLAMRQCGSGRFGTVESVAAGRAILASAIEAGHQVSSAKQVYDAALNGDVWAKKIIQKSAQAIALLCADLRALIGVEKIAIGGSIGLAQGYLDQVKHFLAEQPELFRPTLSPVQLGHDSALIGALALTRWEYNKSPD